jgi:hypothetical protein
MSNLALATNKVTPTIVSDDPYQVYPGTEIGNHGEWVKGAIARSHGGKFGIIQGFYNKKLSILWDGDEKPEKLSWDEIILCNITVLPSHRIGDVVEVELKSEWMVEAIHKGTLHLVKPTPDGIRRTTASKWQCKVMSCYCDPVFSPKKQKAITAKQERNRVAEVKVAAQIWLGVSAKGLYHDLIDFYRLRQTLYKFWIDSLGEWKALFSDAELKAGWLEAIASETEKVKMERGYKGVRMGDRVWNDSTNLTGIVKDINERTAVLKVEWEDGTVTDVGLCYYPFVLRRVRLGDRCWYDINEEAGYFRAWVRFPSKAAFNRELPRLKSILKTTQFNPTGEGIYEIVWGGKPKLTKTKIKYLQTLINVDWHRVASSLHGDRAENL